MLKQLRASYTRANLFASGIFYLNRICISLTSNGEGLFLCHPRVDGDPDYNYIIK
ncbi:MAG: hypothetical protein ACD_12C00633G0010 [uncultured bacterium]|nr:MAG: hypothetical protein ACD_12C00633G0010 [uncultured bacterium]